MSTNKYRPSNGTEGNSFIVYWCGSCARDRSLREGEPIDECDDDEVCDIVGRALRHQASEPEYPSEWTYDMTGRPCCTAFIPAGDPIPPTRCPYTADMFPA